MLEQTNDRPVTFIYLFLLKSLKTLKNVDYFSLYTELGYLIQITEIMEPMIFAVISNINT